MKSGMPWSVKGIEPQVREAAKDAARRSGLTLGEWLKTAILEQAEPDEPSPPPRGLHPRVKERMPSITEELAMMTGERQETRLPRNYGGPSSSIDFDHVIERIENNERYLGEALSAINDRLKVLQERSARPEAQAGYKSLEAAIRNIVDHIEVSERHSESTLTTLKDQISALTRRDGEAEARNGARLREIETLLNSFARRLEAAEKDDSEERIAALEAALQSTTGRIQSLSATLLADTREALKDFIRQELGALERQVQSLAGQSQASLKQSSAAQADMARTQSDVARLKSDLAGLEQRIDVIKSEVVSERDLHALQRAIEQLSGRISQLPMGEIEKRLNEAARRISDVEIRGRALPQAQELDQRLREVEDVLAEGRRDLASQDVLQAIEDRIAHMDRRLAGNEERLTALAGIERSMSQIFQALEDNRQDAHDIAQDAARRVAEEFLRQPSSDAASASGEVAALEEALAAVKEQSARSDRETQETLDALHDTLEEIVNKLAELEAGQRAILERGPAASGHVAAQPGASPKPDPALSDAAPAGWQSVLKERLAKAEEAFGGAEEPSPHKGSDIERDLFEPQGDDAGRGAPPVAAAEDDAFIQAARRAAQAAAQGSGLSSVPAGAGALEKKIKAPFGASAFPLSLFRRGPSLKPRQVRGLSNGIAAAADAAVLPPENGRRRLLLAAFLLLLAVSAYALRSGMTDDPPPSPAASGVTEPGKPAAPTQKRGAHELERGPEAGELPHGLGPDNLRRAAVSGEAKAQFLVAERFLDGALGSKNPSEAAKWYRKAAQQGLAPAQYRLGSLYERGSGVRRDIAEAKLWYERAAAQGNVKAMHNLGVLLAGEQTPDYGKSARWFRAAADHGLKDSQFNIALLYERGLGVEKDLSQAYFWFSVAARQSDEDAQEKARALAERLSPAAMRAARQRLQSWRPEESAKEANGVSLGPVAQG